MWRLLVDHQERRVPGALTMVEQPRDTRGRMLPVDAMQRFLAKCRFDAATGCVVWTGGTTKGRGHHVPYPAFWFEGKRWFGHRWAAKFIHGLDIEHLHVDHCCPALPRPNTLCVEHLQAITARENRQLQETRKLFIHMQVGLVQYEDIYGHSPTPAQPDSDIPFFTPPRWLPAERGPTNDACPF